jgi:hypothetical protein
MAGSGTGLAGDGGDGWAGGAGGGGDGWSTGACTGSEWTGDGGEWIWEIGVKRRLPFGLSKATLPNARDLALDKEKFIFLKKLCRVFLRRHSTKIFLFFKIIFIECFKEHSTKNLFVECLLVTLGKVCLFFSFFPNFLYCVNTVSGPTCLILVHFSKYLLYLLDLAHLIEFRRIIQIWIATH